MFSSALWHKAVSEAHKHKELSETAKEKCLLIHKTNKRHLLEVNKHLSRAAHESLQQNSRGARG